MCGPRLLRGLVWFFLSTIGPRALGEDVAQIVEEIKASKREGQVAANAEFPERGFISDPDGFTNVRSGPGVGHSVVAVLRVGEPFEFRRDISDWWRVRTASGTVGFVHSSRISASGETKPAWVFADSSFRRLSPQELQGLSAEELWKARNEIFARKGLVFQTAKGRRLAQSLGDEYEPVSANQQLVSDSMNAVERQNIALIEAAEIELGRR